MNLSAVYWQIHSTIVVLRHQVCIVAVQLKPIVNSGALKVSLKDFKPELHAGNYCT